MAVGRQQLLLPAGAPLENSETSGLYTADEYVALERSERINPACAKALGFTTSVEVSRLVTRLRALRESGVGKPSSIRQLYRQLSQLAPKGGFGTFGDLSLDDVRRRFAEGQGLVAVFTPNAVTWRRPDQLRRGRQVFPEPERFVPDGELYAGLWSAIGIAEPTVSDCVDHLARHAQRRRPDEDEGVLIEVYGYLETKLGKGVPADVDRLKGVPLSTGERWWARRPILLLEDPLLRAGLGAALPDRRFWSPPCDVTTLPRLIEALQLRRSVPLVTPLPSTHASERGEDERERLERALNHFSNALGRSGTDLRRQIEIPWATLHTLQLFIYDRSVEVEARDPALADGPVSALVQAFLQREPLQLHVTAKAIGDRDEGGRAIAGLFKRPVRRMIEAEWSSAWSKSEQSLADILKFRSDESEAEANLAHLAADVAQKRGIPLTVTPSRTVSAVQLPPRRLKTVQPGVSDVTIVAGTQPRPFQPASSPHLHKQEPAAPAPESRQPVPNTEYDTGDLERRGWEILTQVLSKADGPQLVDFRHRHRVGADGAIGWRDFVELKASGRSGPNAVAFPMTEFHRALKEGQHYILALVSGLEEGHETQVKLIFDPVRTAGVAEANALRLSGLGEAAGVLVRLNDDGSIVTNPIADARPEDKDTRV